MGMRISTNVSAINAQRTMVNSQREIGKSMSQLASGSRINKAADDAAGLAISENLKSQIRSLGQASRNANDGISMVQTAEGGLSEISNILTRMRELGVQASSDTIGDTERGFLDKEVQQLKSEAQRITQTTRFGTTKLLDGSGDSFDFQVGINNDPEADRISFNAGETNASTSSLGIDGFDFSSKTGAQDALAAIDTAQSQVNGYRANLGALQNRLQSTVDNLGVQHENISAANSRIRDTDVAAATAETTRNQVLLQANTSVLSQANAMPNSALRLIG
ncbi:flagellin [Bdellovibrio bacteriovorus]|uniref:Flagellin n=2 Tax=Bdellovibrio bacteriovorus TaxID=959 RepID=Q6H8R6_BDEBC|nr:flagellin [Bdellovibrio bacteriovorus]AHZ86685.1 flagellin [Bdellovibrio bacteriovorus]BEV67125.1 Flagellin [Bdellovibrio bacteriovorus]CAE78572.1 flagellin [Bdellovibrio bacteriovorus HD100]CAG38105.1 flagellin [Bdellovibrio bacteriovorus]